MNEPPRSAPVPPAWPALPALSSRDTALCTPYPELVAAVRRAAVELVRGDIASPPRHSVPLGGNGALLSMVAVAPDVAVHKLVGVVPDNPRRGLPTVQGHVDVLEARTASPLLRLDAATLTGRRTAAVTLLGIELLADGPPSCVLVVGTGAQALHHVMALRALHPDARIEILGRTHEATERFCAAHHFQGARVTSHADAPTAASAAYASALHAVARVQDSDADVVIACTSSATPVYALPAMPGRLLVAIGAFRPDRAEIDPATVRASRCVVDDLANALGEAGDLLQARVDWNGVQALGDLLAGAQASADTRPALFKTVGSAAWDLAAARVALVHARGARRHDPQK